MGPKEVMLYNIMNKDKEWVLYVLVLNSLVALTNLNNNKLKLIVLLLKNKLNKPLNINLKPKILLLMPNNHKMFKLKFNMLIKMVNLFPRKI